MIRKTLTILSLIGLLLSVALWGGSYFLYAMRITPPSNIYWLDQGCIGRSNGTGFRASNMTIDDGGTVIGGTDFAFKTSANVWIEASSEIFTLLRLGKNSPTNHWEYAGFKGLQTRWTPSLGLKPFRFILPLWMIAISFAAMAWWLHLLPRYHGRKRKKLGLCVKCGYDLRGSKDRCPECGLSLEKRNTKGESTCEQEC